MTIPYAFRNKIRQRKLGPGDDAPVVALPPLARLWVLRILTALGGHREFINRHDYTANDDAIARALGLPHWIDGESEDEEESRDKKKVRLGGRQAELRALCRAAEEESASIEAPPLLSQNVRRLAQLAGLTTLDERILVFAVLVRSERVLQNACGYLGDMNVEQFFSSLSTVLDLSPAEARSALKGDGALMRSGLLTLKSRSYQEGLHEWLGLLSSDFATQMTLEQADPVNLLRGRVSLAAPGHLQLVDYAHIQKSLDVLNPYLQQAAATQRKGVNIYIHDAPGTGKSQLARALAAALGCELFEVACEDDEGAPAKRAERLQAYRAAQSFFGQRKALIVFDEAEDVFSSGMDFFFSLFGNGKGGEAGKDKGWINRMLENNPLPALWLSNSSHLDPAFMRRFDMVFELPVPPKVQREKIVRAACGGMMDDASASQVVKALAEVETLAPAVVTRAASVVQAVQARHEAQGEHFSAAQKAQVLEQLISNTLEAQGHKAIKKHDPNRLPEVYDPTFIRADADLAAIADELKRNRVNGNASARLCLYGPPGTGKTAYGRWLAEQLDMPLIVKRASDLLSMWVGEAEKNIAAAFREAERENAILLIDEVDSFLQDRRNASKSWETTMVNEMLTQMESYAGIFIASTNLMQGLDQAALRRFDLKVKFDYLLPEQALELLRRHCTQMGLAAPGDADIAVMSRLTNLTPGDYAAVARQHRFRPYKAATQLVAALQGESAIKEGAPKGMGFLQ
jgi:SpoVK/Ycf46/Vps4 family AAA+-type ATPase